MRIGYVAVLVVLAVAAALFWPQADFVVSLRGGRVECKSKLPRNLQVGSHS